MKIEVKIKHKKINVGKINNYEFKIHVKLIIPNYKKTIIMLSFSFSRISFAKASKYLFLVSTQQQTKRTDVCFLWTSSPTFQESIELQQSEDQVYKIKACQATIDRKLKVIGFCVIERKDFIDSQRQATFGENIVFDKDLELIQTVQGRDIAVGRCHLQVRRKQPEQKVKASYERLKASKVSNQTLNKSKAIQNEQIPSKSLQVSAVYSKNNSAVNSPFNSARLPQQNHNLSQLVQQKIDSPKKFKQSSVEGDDLDFDPNMQIKQDQQEQLQNDCSIRFFIHGGTNFYLGSSFSVQLSWGQKECQTRYIKDKIVPQWAQSLTLLGNSQHYVVVNIIDQKKNILQWCRFSLKNIRKIYPYHLKIVFREEYMGDRPVVYLTMMREDLPKFSILEREVRLVVSCDDDNVRNPLKYLMIQSKSEMQMPNFFEVDLRKFSSFDQVNKFIQSFELGDYNWNYFIPLETGKKSLILFKSQLNKELNLFMLTVRNWTLLFSNEQNQKRLTSVSVVQTRENFQNILKKIYYHQQVHAIGKSTEIYGNNTLKEGAINDTNTWRTMAKNYILRNNLLNTSITNLQLFRQQITNKGEQLVKLKKILTQVKSINTTLKLKEKSTLSLNDIKSRKQKLQPDSFKITDIELMLYEKQAELEFKKKRNQEMTQRMESLNVMQQDTTELDAQVVKNAKTLLQQQQKIKLLLLMRKQLPKQRDLISKLQKIFQKKQLDNEMNQLLQNQQQRLNMIRIKKREDLQKVYNLLKEKNSQQDSLKSKVQRAELELVKLNEVYAKLTGL